jgi:hypothetical protein
LAQRSLGGGEEDGAAGGSILKDFKDAEEEALAGRGEEVNAVEECESGEGGWIGVGGEPFASITTLKAGTGEGGAAEEVAGEGVFAGTLFAFDGSELDVRGGHIGLGDELSPGSADADELKGLRRIQRNEGKAIDRAEAGGWCVDLSGGLHNAGRSSPPPMPGGYAGRKQVQSANVAVIGVGWGNMRGRGGREQGKGRRKREDRGCSVMIMHLTQKCNSAILKMLRDGHEPDRRKRAIQD